MLSIIVFLCLCVCRGIFCVFGLAVLLIDIIWPWFLQALSGFYWGLV